MISTQYIKLNMTPNGIPPVLYCSQYDVGRPLGLVVYNGSDTVDLSTYTATIEATRTDRTPITAAVTTSGNVGVFQTTATMTNKLDRYGAKLVLSDSNGHRVASLVFFMVITLKTMDENAEGVQEDQSLYQQYTATVQTIIAQIRSDLAAEIANRQSAVSAEASARQSADNTLQSNINAEASTRATQDASLQSQIDQLIAPSGSAPSAAEVENARIGSDGTVYPTLGDAIRGQVSDVKNALDHLEEIALKYQSSTLVGTQPFGKDIRILLNDNPIPKNIYLGDLYLVTNDNILSLTVTIELTTKNDDGTYTVYDSSTGVVSYSGGISSGDLLRMFRINRTTQKNGTYIFASYTSTSQYARLKSASVTGHSLTVCDTTSGTTFAVRSVSGYEICYLIYAGVTDAYINNVTGSLDVLNNVVGDYTYHQFFNAAQSSGFWNSYIYKNIPTGTKVRITMVGNSANLAFNIRAYDANNNSQLLINTFKDVGGTVEATLTLNAVHIRIQSPISSAISNATLAVVVTTDTQPGLVSDLFDTQLSRVYHIEKDGSGDFTNLAKGIAVATQWFDSIVYVGAGTWDILEELGQDYLDTASSANQGIVLKNRVHVICSSKAYIKCLYDGTDADVINYISAFNAGPYGFTLENADIEVANVRYCVHDERNAETDHYDNYYINCRMKNTNQTSGSRSQCIGGGLGYDGHVVIEGCTFENPLRENYGVVSYHNAHGAATDSRSLIEVKGCYFYGTNTFRAGCYGNTTAITQCLVHGNSMGAEPYMTQEDPNYSNVNMEIIAWNNEIRTA